MLKDDGQSTVSTLRTRTPGPHLAVAGTNDDGPSPSSEDQVASRRVDPEAAGRQGEERTAGQKRQLIRTGSEQGARRILPSRIALPVAAVVGVAAIAGATMVVQHFGSLPFVTPRPNVTALSNGQARPMAMTAAVTHPDLDVPNGGATVPRWEDAPAGEAGAHDDPFGGSGTASPTPTSTVPAAAISSPRPEPIPITPTPVTGPAPAQAPQQAPAPAPALQAQPATLPSSAAPDASASPGAGVALSSGVSPGAQNGSEVAIALQLAQKLQILTDRLTTMEQRVAGAEKDTDERLSNGLGRIQGHLDALEHREDQTEIALQKSASASSSAQTGSKSAAPGQAAGSSASAPAAQKPSHPAPVVHQRRYTVQAGAPDLAYLTDDQNNALRVEPGTELEGWGKVVSVTQSGTGWVVHTEHGTIH
jgi:hypothetical protein